jgi:hypothetical protein
VISLVTNFLYFTFFGGENLEFFFHSSVKKKTPAKNPLSQSQKFETKKIKIKIIK